MSTEASTTSPLSILIGDIYEDCWLEYFDWQRQDAQKTITALLPQTPSSSSSRTTKTRLNFKLGNLGIESTPILTSELPEDIDPVASVHPYESTVPASRSIQWGDDDTAMPFLPYADDSSFPVNELLEEYDNNLSWTAPGLNSQNDPDAERIAIETGKRVLLIKGVTLDDMDEFHPVSGGWKQLLGMTTHRHILPWCSSEPLAETVFWPPIPTHAESLLEGWSIFCQNVNCILPWCSIHLNPGLYSKPRSAKPELSNIELKTVLSRTPCGASCFLLSTSAEYMPVDMDELAFVRSFIDTSPDTLPCDIAKICRVPCSQIISIRRTELPDTVKPPKVRSHPGANKNTRNEETKPCSHLGTCSTAACRCFQRSVSCQHACRCGPRCNRRRKGCQCSELDGIPVCRTEACPCFRAHRECDPVVCKVCNAKDFDGACLSAQIQHGSAKKVAVRPSGSCGLGLFLVEDAANGSLIGEYTGQRIHGPTSLSREPLYLHRSRYYTFDLNADLVLDAGYVGNEMKFINHCARSANVGPSVMFVNGEHRIGVFAIEAIAAGEEALMNYGPNFNFVVPESSSPRSDMSPLDDDTKEIEPLT